jgi:hypothetical protein
MKIILFLAVLIIGGISLIKNSNTPEEVDIYSKRVICQRILLEELEHLQEEVEALEQVYGPALDWVNGSKHTPDFLRTSIKQNRSESLERLIYLKQRVLIAKSLSEKSIASGGSSKHLCRLYLVNHQDELYKSSKEAAAAHFVPVKRVLSLIEGAETNEEIDRSIREFSNAQTF